MSRKSHNLKITLGLIIYAVGRAFVSTSTLIWMSLLIIGDAFIWNGMNDLDN